MSFKPTRRDVLTGALGSGLALPLIRPCLAPKRLQAAGVVDKILVVLQLRGGCDGLHTLAPIENATYLKGRGSMAIPKAKALRLTPTSPLWWHPAMSAFKALYDRGDLAILQGIGYPNPNLSHFRSEDIWSTGDNKATTVSAGWLGTWRNSQYTGTFSLPMMDIEGRRNDSFVGTSLPVFTSRSAFQFLMDASTYSTRLDQSLENALLQANAKVLRPVADPNLKFVTDGLIQTISDMALIQNTGKAYKPAVAYPTTDTLTTRLSERFQLIASYITGGLDTQVYYTDTGGFDTHANEVLSTDPVGGSMATLLARFSGVVKAFLDDMKAQSQGKKVIVMIWSEFGRRFGPNGNNGTDHGQAGLAYVAGEPAKGGLYGKYPDLDQFKTRTDFHKISLPFTTDFRSMYATVIDTWLGGDHTKVLPGTFPKLAFL